MSEPLDLEPIAFRDAAYGPDLAAPAALRQDYHGQCVWDRRDLLAEVERLRGEVARYEEVYDRDQKFICLQQAALARQAEQITAVRALHVETPEFDWPEWREPESVCADCGYHWPCPTSCILDGTS